ncbi:MAG: hypothetical protein BGO86_02805 [Chryseobacterium sp. 36-9]|uniref:hypothetical protein n=1 Tax=uncultured Empedobacter sp. TaxID=410844 RepID=UPI00096306FD|nr:hypothetical protein [uncultured Empedobacter sp.]OJX33613.1 MAG: hypothetical protein BGO86_02805 [Chryseobacterium sp. 36-9]
MEEKLKHLEFIQNIILRMANNSFIIKGWCITLIAGLFALAEKDSSKVYVLIAFIPILAFWILDAYFLHKEIAFRCLYEDVRKKENGQIDFNMNVSEFEKEIKFSKTLFSETYVYFYPFLLAINIIIMFIIP